MYRLPSRSQQYAPSARAMSLGDRRGNWSSPLLYVWLAAGTIAWKRSLTTFPFSNRVMGPDIIVSSLSAVDRSPLRQTSDLADDSRLLCIRQADRTGERQTFAVEPFGHVSPHPRRGGVGARLVNRLPEGPRLDPTRLQKAQERPRIA